MSIYELERRYLSSLLKGGEIQEITLTEKNEELHGKIRRERNERGRKYISPQFVDEKLGEYADGPEATVDIAEELHDLQKKERIKEAYRDVDFSKGADGEAARLAARLAEIAETKGKDRLLSASELQREPYEDIEFAVQDILPMGLTVLMGAPKMGKSWLLLMLAETVTSGLGKFLWKRVQTFPVLYYTLEDGFRICKKRLVALNSAWRPTLYLRERAGGAAGILRDIETTGARLVIIDTLGAFAEMENSNSYDETTRRIRELKQIAATCDIAMVVSHHTRKAGKDGVTDWAQEAIGSQGIIGAADCVMSLLRNRGEANGKLLITGRAVEDYSMSINFFGGIWDRYTPEVSDDRYAKGNRRDDR